MDGEQSVSLLLYDILNEIGITEIWRRKYQEYGIQCELIETIANYSKGFSVYRFGSCCEGTTTPGLAPDLDTLMCNNNIPVITYLEEAPEKGFAALLTTTDETKPGYVKLQVVDNRSVVTSRSCEIQISRLPRNTKMHSSGIYYWKKYFEPVDFGIASKMLVSGPSSTLYVPNENGWHYDNIFAYRGSKWPIFANEWVSRKRYQNWPSNESISYVQTLGFFVVHVGHPDSKEKDIEWRVSFSLQERHLIFHLTDVQYKCYVVLKLINHDLMKGAIGESITSYHCKTCLFYAIEQNPTYMWVPDNIFNCVIKCLNILLEWTKKNYCPNYFIPNENIFDGKITSKIRIKVIDVLESLLTEKTSFLKRIQMDKLGDYFINAENPCGIKEIKEFSYNAYSRLIVQIKTEAILDLLAMKEKILLTFVTMKECDKSDNEAGVLMCSDSVVLDVIDRHMIFLQWLNSIESITEHTCAQSREVVGLLHPFFVTSLASHFVVLALKCTNYDRRNICITLSQLGFKTGLLSDVTPGRLKYITYLYICEHYISCERELVALEQSVKPYVLSVSIFRATRPRVYPQLKEKLKSQIYCLTDIFKNDVSACLIFLPTEIEIIPYALKFEPFRSVGTLLESRNKCTYFWYDWVVVESRVYMYFLLYLLASKRKSSKKIRFLYITRLEETLKQTVDHKETTCNLLAWALIQEKCIRNALEYMVISWNIVKEYDFRYQGLQKHCLPHHNAVKWHMLLLLRRIWFSENAVCFCFKCFGQNFCRVITCSKCQIAKYCSKHCQQMDFYSHKKVCILFH